MKLRLPKIELESLDFEYEGLTVSVRQANNSLEEEDALSEEVGKLVREGGSYNLSNPEILKASLKLFVHSEDVDKLLDFFKKIPSPYATSIVEKIREIRAKAVETIKKNLKITET